MDSTEREPTNADTQSHPLANEYNLKTSQPHDGRPVAAHGRSVDTRIGVSQSDGQDAGARYNMHIQLICKHVENSDPNDSRSWIEIRETQSKGMGVFAIRKIPAGTCVLTESPLIFISKEQETDPSSIERAFDNLAKARQKEYLKLFDNERRQTRVDSIYYSNCYDCRYFTGSGGGSCVGATVSRINHSCIPNAQFYYDQRTDLIKVYAIKAIPRGKELLSDYERATFDPAERRKRKLVVDYGFVCQCEACEPETDFWEKSDQRRKALAVAKRTVKQADQGYSRMQQAGSTYELQDPRQALRDLERLLIKEGISGLTLANTYKSLAKWADRHGQKDEVRSWIAKEAAVCSTCFGKESYRSIELQSWLQQDRDA